MYGLITSDKLPSLTHLTLTAFPLLPDYDQFTIFQGQYVLLINDLEITWVTYHYYQLLQHNVRTLNDSPVQDLI